jgi:hypothetical protein
MSWCREYEHMPEDDIKADRYNKFRKLGEFREYLVEGGNWSAADERRNAASGVTTKTGRWAEVWHLHCRTVNVLPSPRCSMQPMLL